MAAGSSTRDRRWVMIAIAVAVVVLDRVTKLWVERHVQLGHAIVVIPRIFRITHVLNTGAAFSMFEQARSPALVRTMLIAFSVLAVLVVLLLLWKLGRSVTGVGVALALILGGALGNLYDRIHYAYVIDFLEVHIVHYHWPDFNVADSCIVMGACLLLLDMLRPQTAGRSPQTEDRSPQSEDRNPQLDDRSPQREDRSPQREDRSPQRADRRAELHGHS